MDTPVDATVRITPLSLLWSSLLGTVTLASGVLPILFWWTAGGAVLSPVASSVGLTAGIGGVLLFMFAVGYRRHGRPVPTTARVDNDQLVIRVPEAWGTLIREELRLDVIAPPSSDDGRMMRGAAEEWWDPGRYEVRVPASAADVLKQRLAEPGS